MQTITSFLATLARPGTGISSRPAPVKPEKLLELYDMEGCPFCRLTREALTELDLDAMIYPCPKDGQRYRPKAIELGGKAMFPFLVDPNTGSQMYESLDTIEYLFEQYGKRAVPLKWQLGPLQKLGSSLASAARLGAGIRLKASILPDKPLELFSFESSPFARPVRETLTELELPYILRNTGRTEWKEWVPPPLRSKLNIEASPTLANRQRLLELTGKVSVPFLIDPNNDHSLYESADIVDYLLQTYSSEANS